MKTQILFSVQILSLFGTISCNPTLNSTIPEHPSPPLALQIAHLQVFEQPKACDPFIESSSNEFTTPNYPGEYTDAVDCIKIISAAPGEVIRLRFIEHFHLEPDEQCRYDFLEVRDGQFGYSTLIGKLCGTTPPTVLESSGRHLWLRFHSDQDIHYIGFRAFYEFVPSSLARPDLDDCSFHLTNLEANITSEDLGTETILNHRKDLSIQSLDCTWVIEAPKNQRIYLQFKDFNLEKANDCTFNFVEVYGSKTELYSKEGRLHQFCGSDTKPIFSKSNVLHLRFFTALSIEQTDLGIGFKTKLWVYYSFYRDLSDFKVPGPEPAEPEKCKELDEFDCTDNTCIDLALVCNQAANCKQGNDEDRVKCKSNKAAFQMTMDLIVIAFIGCFLAAGMCSGLILNICRKLRQDKIELEEIRANLHKSESSMGNTSGKSNKQKSTSNSEHDLKSINIQDLKPTPIVSVQPEEETKVQPPNRNVSENSSSAESKDTVIYRPYYKEPVKEEVPKSSAFGFTFKPMRPSPQVQEGSIPYSPPPPYNPAAALLNKFTQPKVSKKQVQVYDEPPNEPEEIHVIEVRDCACQTRESFTEKYLANVHFGQQRYYKPSSARSSPVVPTQSTSSQSKRAPLARGEAVEMIDVPRKHVRKVPKGPADVLMYPKSPSSIASVDASTGSLELLSEVDEEADEEKKPIPQESESEDEDDIMPESKSKHRGSVSGYSELD